MNPDLWTTYARQKEGVGASDMILPILLTERRGLPWYPADGIGWSRGYKAILLGFV
jgi:hypothetical protein